MEIRPSGFKHGLEKAAWQLNRAKIQLDNTRLMAERGLAENAYSSSLTLAQEIERLALLARSLPAYTGHPRAAYDVEQILTDSIPVEIGYTEQGWFSISIPALLPRKERGSADYIRAILYPAMRSFFQGKVPVYYPDCVLIYRHVYDRERPEREYRDHDNIEINMVSDIIALYVMKDDSALRCAHYYCSAAGENDRTEVYVVHKSEFMEWLEDAKAFPSEGIDLLENYP